MGARVIGRVLLACLAAAIVGVPAAAERDRANTTLADESDRAAFTAWFTFAWPDLRGTLRVAAA